MNRRVWGPIVRGERLPSAHNPIYRIQDFNIGVCFACGRDTQYHESGGLLWSRKNGNETHSNFCLSCLNSIRQRNKAWPFGYILSPPKAGIRRQIERQFLMRAALCPEISIGTTICNRPCDNVGLFKENNDPWHLRATCNLHQKSLTRYIFENRHILQIWGLNSPWWDQLRIMENGRVENGQ